MRHGFAPSALLFVIFGCQAEAAPQRTEIAPSASEVAFRAYKLGVLPIDGKFTRFSGWLTFDPATGTVTTLATDFQINGYIFEGLTAAGPYLYGVANFPSFSGSIFKVDPASGSVTKVADLPDLPVTVPRIPVGLCSDGTFLYGMTSFGGDSGRGAKLPVVRW